MATRQVSMAYCVLAVCTGLNVVSRGVAESFAVFLLPLSIAFSASRAETTLAYSSFMLVLGLCSPLTGWAVDRFGPRRVYQLGIALCACACFSASLAPSLTMVYVSIGLMLPFGVSGMGTIAASNLVSRWFKSGLSTAMGLLAAALGTGILIFGPLSQSLVEWLGWRDAYRALALALAAIWILQFFLPWQRMRAEANMAESALAVPVATPSLGFGALLHEATRTPLFWALFGIMFVTSVSTYAVTVQLVAYLVSTGLTPLHAAWVFGATGLASILGMLAAGHLARQWGEVRVASISYAATVLGLLSLGLFEHLPHVGFLVFYVLLFGTMQGSRGPLVAVLAARGFAGAHQSTMYGFVLIGMGLGGALGSWASAALFDWFQSYKAMMMLSAAAAVSGYAIFWRMKAWNKA